MLERNNKLIWLMLTHIFIICLSNTLVQYPFTLMGFHTTFGAFTYPLIFILTDLTTRLLGQEQARKIVLMAMVPGLFCSFFIANFYNQGELLVYNSVVLRIAFASFFAYVLGQLLDISIFQKLRQSSKWWIAPSVATIFGNLLDTYSFFFIAFYQGNNAFLSAHWLEIATVDLAFKIIISLLSFVPIYGLILKLILDNKDGLVSDIR